MENQERYLGIAEAIGGWNAKATFYGIISIEGSSKEIVRCRRLIYGLKSSMKKMEGDMLVYLDDDELKYLKERAEQIMSETCDKAEMLLEREYRPHHVIMDPKAFCNLTTIPIPEDIMLALSWGPKFTFPYILNKHNILRYLAQLETTVKLTIPTGAYDLVNHEISHYLQSIDNTVYSQDIQWLLFLSYRLEAFLKKHANIRPVVADKGKVVVLMELTDYEEKIARHLENETHYQKLDIDPLVVLIATENELINALKNNVATKDLVGAYENNCLVLPKFYATIKIHKNNTIRPITSCAGNTVGAKLNHVFNGILTEIFPPNGRHCKNASEFKDRIVNIPITDDSIMVSFDAINMFTSIPTSLIIEIIKNKAVEFKIRFQINEDLLLRIMQFLFVDCMVFTVLDGIYRQKHGLPMGGAISPLCCRLVMDFILDSVSKIIPNPVFYNIYVDDTIFILKKEHVDLTLRALISVNPHIRFTVELEKLNRLNFLNVTLHRNGNNIITNWYKKELASNRILNYYSSHKRSTIMNTATHFIRTVLDLSDPDFFKENRNIIEQTLVENCFPECIRIILLQENYTLMKLRMNTDKKKNAQFVSFPHQLMNGRVKSIIRSYKTTDAVLTESIKNNKINHIKVVKTKTAFESKTNMILQATCVCKQKIKIEMTGFNQTGGMLKSNMIGACRDAVKCENDHHIFRDVKFIGGLNSRGQTRCYLHFLQYIERKRLVGLTYEFPNRCLRKVIDKFIK